MSFLYHAFLSFGLGLFFCLGILIGVIISAVISRRVLSTPTAQVQAYNERTLELMQERNEFDEAKVAKFAPSARQYFAAASLPLFVKLWQDCESNNDAQFVAEEAFKVADAMLRVGSSQPVASSAPAPQQVVSTGNGGASLRV